MSAFIQAVLEQEQHFTCKQGSDLPGKLNHILLTNTGRYTLLWLIGAGKILTFDVDLTFSLKMCTLCQLDQHFNSNTEDNSQTWG